MSDGFLGGLETATTNESKPAEEAQPGNAVSAEEAPLQAERAALEQSAEQKDTFLEQSHVQTPEVPSVQTEGALPAPEVIVETAPPDEVMTEVEKILEDGLGNFVETMPKDAQERFLAKGREVSTSIATMVRSFKVELRSVMHLVREWLMTIPGINRYFLEQEAKIKTDRIIKLAKNRKQQAEHQI